MDQAKEKPKFILCRRALDPEGSNAWTRFKKALTTLGELEEIELDKTISDESLTEYTQKAAHVFVDLSLADKNVLNNSQAKNILLIRKDAFAWNTPQVREKYQAILLKYPCLLLEETATTDLVRILHCFIHPKRQSGISQLMEKGATILGEKILDLETLGALNDRVANYLERLEGFELKDKIPNIRQILCALLPEGFKEGKRSSASFNCVDFQLSATREKIVVHMRFPRGSITMADFPKRFVGGESFLWQSLWLNSDILFVIDHQAFDEIEVNAIITRSVSNSLSSFRSTLWKTQEKSAKKESLLTAPSNYKFQLISEIKVKDLSGSLSQEINPDELSKDLNLDALPEAVVKKLSDLEKERNFLKESSGKREKLLKDLKTKFTEVNNELTKKQNEIAKFAKAAVHQQETFKIKLEELEQKAAKSQNATGSAPTSKDSTANIIALHETVAKLEAAMRAAENDKAGLSEKIILEQKRLAAQEQKYAHLFKENSGKDKEIQELKATLLKSKKESNDAGKNAANANTANNSENSTKMKELEAREGALKQELRKALFKLEAQEKNVKAIQNEAAEKNKLLEHKLQAAKSKEVELLKKIEDLSNALKKAAKAA